MKGATKRITDYFICSNNRLISLSGIPEFIGGNLWLYGNSSLKNVSDIWNSIIKGSVNIELNKNIAILPLVKFDTSLRHEEINLILIKNMGSSKQNILDFQYDLMENGYDDHARWLPI